MNHEQALLHSQPGAGAAINFTGRWTNELNSKMLLTQSGDVLTGKYVSAVSDDGLATGVLSGYVNGNLIAFSVHWDTFQSITSWVGQLIPGQPVDTIKTLWQMVHQVDPGSEWASINVGADTFIRNAADAED